MLIPHDWAVIWLDRLLFFRCGGTVVLSGWPAGSGRDGETRSTRWLSLCLLNEERPCQVLQCPRGTYIHLRNSSPSELCDQSSDQSSLSEHIIHTRFFKSVLKRSPRLYLFDQIYSKTFIPIMAKLNLQHHYSRLQCHMILQKSF